MGGLSRYGVPYCGTSHDIVHILIIMDSTVISQFFNSPYGEKGQVHLPGKELRYLRTVIVTADIDEGLKHSAVFIAIHDRHS